MTVNFQLLSSIQSLAFSCSAMRAICALSTAPDDTFRGWLSVKKWGGLKTEIPKEYELMMKEVTV